MRYLLILLLLATPAYAIELPERPQTLNRAVTLNWIAPVTRANGTALSQQEIGGYEIAYAVNGSDSQIINVPPEVLTFETGTLDPGSYEFAIAVYDQAGLYSEWSGVVTVLIADNSPPSPVELSFFERVIAWLFGVFEGFV
jgi:hypothetical protein